MTNTTPLPLHKVLKVGLLYYCHIWSPPRFCSTCKNYQCFWLIDIEVKVNCIGFQMHKSALDKLPYSTMALEKKKQISHTHDQFDHRMIQIGPWASARKEFTLAIWLKPGNFLQPNPDDFSRIFGSQFGYIVSPPWSGYDILWFPAQAVAAAAVSSLT